uniref:CHAT domain-containing protein n=1 Tax=Candidatus Kentrum sp. LFY TaxID=2126342 RepID=A0A450WPQ6_9GAMM|nr:MAG: CHAT domain-containing protein [Candidatus Kentron sp. LFY]
MNVCCAAQGNTRSFMSSFIIEGNGNTRRKAFPYVLFLWVSVLGLWVGTWSPGLAAATGTDTGTEITDRLTQGEAALASGYIEMAETILVPLLDRVGNEANASQYTRLALALARLHLGARRPSEASMILANASNAALCKTIDTSSCSVAHDSAAMCAAIVDIKARLLLLQGFRERAVDTFHQALTLARCANDPASLAVIQLNRLSFVLKEPGDIRPVITEVDDALQHIPHGLERLRLSLALGRLAHPWDLAVAHRHLIAVVKDENSRLAAQALVALATVYQTQKRFREALTLVHRAFRRLAEDPAAFLRLRLEFLQGVLFTSLGRPLEALKAYRRALSHLKVVHPDLPVTDLKGNSLFQEIIAPLYRKMTDLLLRQAAHAPEEKAQILRREAQESLDAFRFAELQDYFKNACAVTREPFTRPSVGTATLYPILLNNRIELLLGIGDIIHQASVPVERPRVARSVRKLALSLRVRNGRIVPYDHERAIQLYRWLIAPVTKWLQKNDIDTLIYVPDGVLRILPLVALWDGKRFLVERYQVVTAPGLGLIDSNPRPAGPLRAFLAGLSEPGPVVAKLPSWMTTPFLRGSNVRQVGTRGTMTMRGVSLRALGSARESRAMSDHDLSRLKQALALPGVAKEIAAIAGLLPGDRVENETFHLRAVEEAIGLPYRIVHIASHSVFTGDPERSFVLTYDDLLSINRIATLFQPKAFDKVPVELLTLSACQTAEGDDRSPLGLIGVAVQSGARSALGALWPVEDSATQELLTAFYTYLQTSGTSKARALQRAQLELQTKEKYRHPLFWAPFILVGNWQ